MRHRDALFCLFRTATVCSAILTASVAAQQQSSPGPPSKTQVVLLGTGNPFPDPDRSGPATAIVVNGSAYLVDFGELTSCTASPSQSSRDGAMLFASL